MPWLSRRIVPIAAAFCLLGACGYIGEPLPPSLNIPRPVDDLRVVQRGDKLVVQFTVQDLTTDGVVLKTVTADLRAGEGTGGGAFEPDDWAARAAPVPNSIAGPGPVEIELPARQWAGREIILGVRIAGRKRHFSDWSNLVVQRVVSPLETPLSLKAEAVPAGVRVSWAADSGGADLEFRIYRREPGEEATVPIGQSGKPEFVDAAVRFGRTYEYAVQTVRKIGESIAESEMSSAVSITPEDRFPPAAPAGLTAIPSVQSIELSWDRNTDPDLNGYHVYRASGSAPFARIGGLLDTPNFSDRTVKSGIPYRYAVTAVDQEGNESAQSAPAQVAAP
jgi:hypothetical protein